MESILRNPSNYDSIYKYLQRLFKHDSPYNLSREKKTRFQIRRLAWKRFILGYPPRKRNDTSIGDAINWGWIISCANSCGKDIILITRDNAIIMK
ncbi:MAG: PIN domain-containing protein [Candidatus Nitrosoglobus sp.]